MDAPRMRRLDGGGGTGDTGTSGNAAVDAADDGESGVILVPDNYMLQLIARHIVTLRTNDFVNSRFRQEERFFVDRKNALAIVTGVIEDTVDVEGKPTRQKKLWAVGMSIKPDAYPLRAPSESGGLLNTVEVHRLQIGDEVFEDDPWPRGDGDPWPTVVAEAREAYAPLLD